MMYRYFFPAILLLISVCLVPLNSSLAKGGEKIIQDIKPFIDNGAYVVTKDGRSLAVHNQHKGYVPASIIKIATALAALDILGPAYRFETAFFLDDQDNLYIKGSGDPFLVSEEVEAILGRLKDAGCERINNIYLDNSAFDIGRPADGTGTSDNPYDARNDAISVNFNTVNIQKDKTGKVTSAEQQTPTLPLMERLADRVGPGTHRINISWQTAGGTNNIIRYAGELFRAFQEEASIAGHGSIELRRTPDTLEPFYIHQSSKTLEDVIGPLMLYSNNFIANQLFLAVGAAKYGFPATWEKGRTAFADYLLETFNMTGKNIKIHEGSGLSRKNRVTAQAMIQLLDSFRTYSHLLPRDDGVLMKSGTLEGVYSYAGYFAGDKGLDSFVLILNQEKNYRDRVLEGMKRIYDAE